MMDMQPSLRRGFFRRPPAAAPDEVVYAVGDIHGRLDLFWQLVEQMDKDFTERGPTHKVLRMILLGDFIDRGPSSRPLIQALMLAQKRGAKLDVMLGNHEALLLDSLEGDEHAQKLWLKMGGLAAIESFGIDPPEEDESPMSFSERLIAGIGTDIIEWLRELPVSLESGDYLFCHAGIKPGVPLRHQKREDMLWIRKAFMDSRRDHGAVVVHGHNIVDDVEVRRNRISIDTGAYRSGRLSAVCLDGTERHFLST